MARGKKGHRARSYGSFRKARIAPRGQRSVRATWPYYLFGIVVLILIIWMFWAHRT